ncbi:MAG: MBOAT family O-acyltransferase, partial [Deltaproteobacteria bacterium]
GLFVSFFPQLIAGPIVHHQEMMPQFKKDRYLFSHSHMAVGATIFAIGLFKKVILADSLALYATPVFDAVKAGGPVGTLAAWIGVLSYTFQIYFDFSGYSDMAIGLGRMFGIKLPLNFNSPYKATGAIEFWRRWHMTLSRMLRDYLYIPLGGNRRGRIRRYANVMIVMLLGGLWHGAHWNFVLWGACHGAFLMVNHAWRSAAKALRWAWAEGALGRQAAWGVTFLGVVLAWVLFRAEGFAAAMRYYREMFVWSPAAGPYPLKVDHFMAILVSLLFVRLLPNTQEFMQRYQPAVDFDLTRAPAPLRPLRGLRWKPSWVWGLVFGALFSISIFNMTKVTEFLYFQF